MQLEVSAKKEGKTKARLAEYQRKMEKKLKNRKGNK